jgi:hypothetical protein
MFRKSFLIAILAAAAALLTPAVAHAWGARHVGYTHVGPNGVYHYGANAAVGPYGAYGGAHAGYHSYGGATYHAGYGAGGYYGGAAGAYHYNTGYGGAYHYGTVPAGGYGYAAGAYRRW